MYFLFWFSLYKKKQSQIFTKHKSKFLWKNNSQIVPSPFMSTNSNRNCLIKIQTLWKINHLIVSVWKIGEKCFFLPLCSWWLYCLNHSFGLSQMHFGVLNLYVLAWYVLMSMYMCVWSVWIFFFSFSIFRQNAAFRWKAFRRESMHIYATMQRNRKKTNKQQHHQLCGCLVYLRKDRTYNAHTTHNNPTKKQSM